MNSLLDRVNHLDHWLMFSLGLLLGSALAFALGGFPSFMGSVGIIILVVRSIQLRWPKK